jgi:hypothetical protein
MAAPITTKALKTVRSVAGLSMVCIILASVNIDAVAPETLSQLASSVINENKMMSKVPTEVDKHLTKAEDELTNLEPLLESASRPADPDELRHPDGADESVNTFYYGYYNYRYCYYYYYGYTYTTYCGYLTYQPTCCGFTCCASSYNYCNQYDQCSYYADDDDDDDDDNSYQARYCGGSYCGYYYYQPVCCGTTCCSSYYYDYCNAYGQCASSYFDDDDDDDDDDNSYQARYCGGSYCGYYYYQPVCCGTTCCSSYYYDYCNAYGQCASSYFDDDDDDDDDDNSYQARYCGGSYCGYYYYQPSCCGTTCCTYDDDSCNSCDNKTNNVVSIVIGSVVGGIGGFLLLGFGIWWFFGYYRPRQAAALEYMKASTVATMGTGNSSSGQLEMQPVSRTEPAYYAAGASKGPSQPYYAARVPSVPSLPGQVGYYPVGTATMVASPQINTPQTNISSSETYAVVPGSQTYTV